MVNFGVDLDCVSLGKPRQKQLKSTPWVTMHLLIDKDDDILYIYVCYHMLFYRYWWFHHKTVSPWKQL